jgi:hypothetical protein
VWEESSQRCFFGGGSLSNSGLSPILETSRLPPVESPTSALGSQPLSDCRWGKRLLWVEEPGVWSWTGPWCGVGLGKMRKGLETPPLPPGSLVLGDFPSLSWGSPHCSASPPLLGASLLQELPLLPPPGIVAVLCSANRDIPGWDRRSHSPQTCGVHECHSLVLEAGIAGHARTLCKLGFQLPLPGGSLFLVSRLQDPGSSCPLGPPSVL